MPAALPTPDVAATNLATAATPVGAPNLSIIGMFMHADFVVKAVMLMLLFASFWCWAIIFEKLFQLRKLKSQMQEFERGFWSGELLEDLYNKIKGSANHAMSMIFVAGMHEWKSQDTKGARHSEMRVGLKERIFQSMQLVKNQEMDRLERKMTVLATVGSASPFVGLFGTVWGIMSSFQAIAAMQNITLAVVAPGIAEALLATAVGLFAAIPAVIFYNKFNSDLTRMGNQLDDFSAEFGSILTRELEKE